jgi:CAP-Gly domain-containing linker protein 1
LGSLLSYTRADSQLNREVSELESLIESKIYREDELEQRAHDLERELDRLRPTDHTSQHGHSRNSSIATTGTDHDDRCELCEGPHSLDACPVFSGEVVDDVHPAPAKSDTGKFCADCEVRLIHMLGVEN